MRVRRGARVMRIALIAAGLLFLAAIAAATPAGAEDKLVGTYYDLGTTVVFKAPEDAVKKLLPEGWEPAPVGNLGDANLFVAFLDWLAVQTPDGTPGEPGRFVTLIAPVRKTGSEAVVSMILAGWSSNPAEVPGPYGNFTLAKASVDYRYRTDAGGRLNTEESWDFADEAGDAIAFRLNIARGQSRHIRQENRVYSAAKPEFYRINKSEIEYDLFAGPQLDDPLVLSFKATGPKLEPLFDGSQKLVGVTAIRWGTHQILSPQ